ncbi:phosphatidylglycerol/phosphatidylinositol transfer protein-like [Dendronephthya gigantea]|uniref:phosphatidylglycerol/phosphatidylinositol transfer protein-like n=1 Tax=Dendronephthya gigantea TaxID=151771 RepID=UPI00106A7B0C|nr:phosphatidylglycerol/phosphatidylinositol transfer protein-like [Dendronephthya gigantea]
MFMLAKSRFLGIGYKKRVCMVVFLALICLIVIAKQYFCVKFSDIRSIHKAFTGKSARSNFDWDGWVKKNNYLSIGDVYDMCDSKNENRIKVGKAILSYDSSNGRIYATLVANITLGEDLVRGKANIYLSYGGRVLFNETFDVCRDIHVKGVKCPMRKGYKISVNERKKFPSHMPKGYFLAAGHVRNQDNRCLGIVEAEFKI